MDHARVQKSTNDGKKSSIGVGRAKLPWLATSGYARSADEATGASNPPERIDDSLEAAEERMRTLPPTTLKIMEDTNKPGRLQSSLDQSASVTSVIRIPLSISQSPAALGESQPSNLSASARTGIESLLSIAIARDLQLRRQQINDAMDAFEQRWNDAHQSKAIKSDPAPANHVNDVSDVLAETAAALERAAHGLGAGTDSSELISSESEDDQSADSLTSGRSSPEIESRERHGSMETIPTLLTVYHRNNVQPLKLVKGSTCEATQPATQNMDQLSEDSMMRTPPMLYQHPSADSDVRDFAYPNTTRTRKNNNFDREQHQGKKWEVAPGGHGFDAGVSPSSTRATSFGIPRSLNDQDEFRGWRSPSIAPLASRSPYDAAGTVFRHRLPTSHSATRGRASVNVVDNYTHRPNAQIPDGNLENRRTVITDTNAQNTPVITTQNLSLRHPRRNHISLREGQEFSLGRYHRRQPIAREWRTARKRLTATIACFNTVFIGLIAGVYAGEVPRIQYALADVSHTVILGNVLLFIGLALTTILFWPLPLLHGRKPYTLIAFALMLPLQFPQALSVSAFRTPETPLYRCGLLIPRLFTGLAMGFANINQLPTLFDLFGCSLMHERPHEEIVVLDDTRRQGGGMGIWLGVWTFSFVGSISIGFCIGACIIASLNPDWGFYLVMIMLACFLLVNVVAPETRRSPYRRSIAHFMDHDRIVQRRVARGEVKLHISNDGPRWWYEEVWAGVILSRRMVYQSGFFVLMLYTAWIYCQIVVVVLLLGALLSRDYQWRPQYVGLASLALAFGALLATPLTKASLFSRARYRPPRTDSMTMRAPRVTWTSHLMRRCAFTFLLPCAGLAYTLSSPGKSVHWSAPIVFAGFVGFLSNLAMAECVGLTMECFDTCDLQPGVNQRHRLQSMAETTRRRRTNYSAFPRVCAGFFCAQSLGFFLAAAGTGISGSTTRSLGAQTTTALVAAILLVLTVFLMLVLFRFKQVQVIPTPVSGDLFSEENAVYRNERGSISRVDDPE